MIFAFRRPSVVALALLLVSVPLGVIGCGGSEGDESESRSGSDTTSGGEGAMTTDEALGAYARSGSGGSGHSGGTVSSDGQTVTTDDGMAIEGILGTISDASVRSAMNANMDRFGDCFVNRYDAIPVLGGDAQLSFRIRQDGRVRWVHLTSSDVGDRETERCLLDVARRMRFSPGPTNGEAEVQETLGLETPDDVRPPLAWTTRNVASAIRSGRGTLSSCGAEGENLSVPAYIDPGGEVVAVGASIEPADPSVDSAAAMDCVAQAVAGWRFPNPGSYTAKATFDVR